MERDWLAERLEAGVSIEAIAREVGRHPSTVSYWARKHGLTSSHAARHAARGADRARAARRDRRLRLSIRDMADVFERSPSTIRHWLAKHGIDASGVGPPRRPAPRRRQRRPRTPDLPCPTHGVTRHVLRADGGYRCARCRSRASRARGAAACKRSSSTRPAAAARMCGYRPRASPRCSSITSTPAQRVRHQSRGRRRALCRSARDGGRASASSSARTATLRSRPELADVPLRSDDDGQCCLR